MLNKTLDQFIAELEEENREREELYNETGDAHYYEVQFWTNGEVCVITNNYGWDSEHRFDFAITKDNKLVVCEITNYVWSYYLDTKDVDGEIVKPPNKTWAESEIWFRNQEVKAKYDEIREMLCAIDGSRPKRKRQEAEPVL